MKTPVDLVRTPLACPIDGLALKITDRGLTCLRNHNYDISRHGYVNLLPVSLKPSKDPGDSRAMVDARRAVLEHGVYEPIAIALSDMVIKHAKAMQSTEQLLVDAGCGDGYYSNVLRTALRKSCTHTEFIILGVDISKWAILAAAKRYSDCVWVVGNNKQLPVVSHSASIITCLFGFETWHPWSVLQKSGQLVITVKAGPLHLIEIRELIYKTVHIHPLTVAKTPLAAGYLCIAKEQVKYSVSVDKNEIVGKILTMTPHGYRIPVDARRSIDTSLISTLTLDIEVRVYQHG